LGETQSPMEGLTIHATCEFWDFVKLMFHNAKTEDRREEIRQHVRGLTKEWPEIGEKIVAWLPTEIEKNPSKESRMFLTKFDPPKQPEAVNS